MTDTPLRQLRFNGRAYGIALAAATLIGCIVIAHHPDSGNVSAMASEPLLAGVLVLLILFLAITWSGFAWRLGIEHPLVTGGWLSAIGGWGAVALGIVAGAFIVPEQGAIGAGLIRFGMVMVFTGVVFWGHALLHHRGGAMAIAMLGMACGGTGAVVLLTAPHVIDPLRLLIAAACLVVWSLVIAAWMTRGLKMPVT